jgi:hypothetical protein
VGTGVSSSGVSSTRMEISSGVESEKETLSESVSAVGYPTKEEYTSADSWVEMWFGNE